MTDDIAQHALQVAPAAGVGGVGGTILTILTGFKLFARPSDIELAKAQIRAEMAERYLTKEALEPLREDIKYIRERIDSVGK